MKTHLYKVGENFLTRGQTKFEFFHTTECGYVRNKVTMIDYRVNCKLCLKLMKESEK